LIKAGIFGFLFVFIVLKGIKQVQLNLLLNKSRSPCAVNTLRVGLRDIRTWISA